MNSHLRKGFTLVEVLMAIVVAAVGILAIGNFIGAAFKAGGSDRDRSFAYQRAVQMMAEVAAYKPEGAAAQTLETYAQNGTWSFALTTEPSAVPHQSLSGNPRMGTNYKYVRKIDVAAVSGDAFAKQVTVAVYLAKKQTAPEPKDVNKPLAKLSNIIRMYATGSGPTQVYDLYVLSIENLPHIYRANEARGTSHSVYTASATEARLSFEQAIRSLQDRVPGIEFRTHYITRLSQGRDNQYRPYFNNANGLDKDVQKYAYFYPAKVTSSADSPFYYDPQSLNGQAALGDSSNNPVNTTGSYVMADQFNHAVPYAREFTDAALSGTAIAAPVPGIPSGVPNTSTLSPLSLRQLLEDMLRDTTNKYRNAIIVNLHGELFPSLPLRNYADAAKDPNGLGANESKRRLVTHPYKLNFDTTDTIRLLVHPFMEDGSNTPSAGGKFSNVYAGSFDAKAQQARIWLRNIKGKLPGASDDAKRESVTIYAIQREREDGPTIGTAFDEQPDGSDGGGNDKVGYSMRQLWPLDMLILDDSVDWQPGRTAHSGPHLSPLGRRRTYDNGSILPPVLPHWKSWSSRAPLDPHPYPIDVSNKREYQIDNGGTKWGVTWKGDDLRIDLDEFDYDARDTEANGEKYGLRNDNGKFRLYNLQYFPDPYLGFLDQANDHKFVRNTARLIIEFKVTSGSTGRYEVLTQLRTNGESDTDWIDQSTAPSDAVSNSRTWFYVGQTFNNAMKLYWDSTNWQASIPWTDQVQLVGDPRHVPYADARENGLFNPYFSDFRSPNFVYNEVNNNDKRIDLANDWANVPEGVVEIGMGMGMGKGMGIMVKTGANVQFPNSHSSWNHTKYNAPAYFRMWREALYRNSATLVNAGGQPLGFLGQGGEFSLEGKVNDVAISTRAGLYGSTSTTPGASTKDELAANVPVIGLRASTPTDAFTWVALPWIGELYPSGDYASRSNFSSRGNLATVNGGVSPAFERADLGDSRVATMWDNFADRTTGENSKAPHNTSTLDGTHTQGGALVGLLNSTGSGLWTAFKQSGTGTTVATAGDAWQSKVQTQFVSLPAQWGYRNSGGGMPNNGEDPSDWSENLQFLNGVNYAYVDHATSGYYVNGAVLSKGNTISGAPANRRWLFVANTNKPDSSADIMPLFENTLLGIYAAYSDATSASTMNNGAMRPVPRIMITSPLNEDRISGTSLNVAVSQNWQRPDGEPYSPYSTYSGSTANGSGGPDPMRYFLKYRNLQDGVWHIAKVGSVNDATGTIAQPGVLPPAAVATPAPTDTTQTITWDLSGIAAGEYIVRVEAFRQAPSTTVIQNHYAYHEVKITKQ